MNWEIVTGIIALIGVFGLVGGWTLKMGKTLAMLDTTIKALQKTIDDIRKDYKHDKDKTEEKLCEAGRRIEDHETRITILEHSANQ